MTIRKNCDQRQNYTMAVRINQWLFEETVSKGRIWEQLSRRTVRTGGQCNKYNRNFQNKV
jgi:hypothetical protein